MAAIGDLNEEAWEAFASIWVPATARRKTLLTTVGETEKHLYFVLSGIQRAFYIHEVTGREATLVFTYEGSFSGVADSFLTQHPSRYYLETLTASSFLRAGYEQLAEVMNTFRSVEQAILRATSAALEGVLQRQIELQCFSAEEKFRTLLLRSPHVLNLIPHKYLASYLAIDPTTFSKLLGSVRL